MPGSKAQSVTSRKQRRRRWAGVQAMEIVDSLLGKAHRVVSEALDPEREVVLTNPDGTIRVDSDGMPVRERIGGDVVTARWLIDKLAPKNNAVLALPFELGSMSTLDDVLAVAQEVAKLVATGQMTVPQGDAALDFLDRYCRLRAFAEVDELRELLQSIEDRTTGSSAQHQLTPIWGRLAEMQAANTKPAE